MKNVRRGLVVLSLLLVTCASASAAERRSVSVLAEDALLAGHYGAAVELAREAVHAQPASSQVYLVLGLALDSLGRYADAAEAYRVVARLSVDPYRPMLLLGRALTRAGELDRAIEVFDAARALRSPGATRTASR